MTSGVLQVLNPPPRPDPDGLLFGEPPRVVTESGPEEEDPNPGGRDVVPYRGRKGGPDPPREGSRMVKQSLGVSPVDHQ